MSKRKSPANKGKKYPAEVLNEDEMERILKVPSKRAPTGIRNRALLYVGLRGGLRLSEALSLKSKDVDTETGQGQIRVLFGKGKKSRTVGLPDDACLAINAWFEKRKKIGLNCKHPLFSTLKGEPLKASYVRALMKRLGAKAEIDKRVHYHGLRHTCAYRLHVIKGTPSAIVQQALGHSSLNTTDRYLAHVAPIDVLDVMREQ